MNLENWNKRWITSDWHLGESRMDLMMRPFKDQQEHVDHLLKMHNSIVSPNDLVIVVGDAVNQKTPEFLKSCALFNGHKILIRGNHDRVFSDDDLKPYFDLVIEEGEGIVLKINGEDYWLTHYPTQARKDMFNLVGHIHSAWKFQLNSFNVGVDCNHFKPHNLDEIVPFVFNAISNFYDQDVWAAYHDANLLFNGIRGKQDVYFNKKIRS